MRVYVVLASWRTLIHVRPPVVAAIAVAAFGAATACAGAQATSSSAVATFASAAIVSSGAAQPGDASARSKDSAGDRWPAWQVAYDHYDARRGVGGVGIDVLRSGHRSPSAVVRGPRGSHAGFYPGAWSPDGDYLTFIRVPGGLHVVRSDGTGVKRLATNAGSESDSIWAPDGTRIAFVVDCQRDMIEGRCKRGRARIDVVAHDATQRRTLVRPTGLGPDAQIRLEDWSPDGRQLLFVVSGRGGNRLYSIESGGSRQRLLARSPDRDRLGSAAWSSDGRLVAYKRRCGERVSDVYCDVAVMNADGTAKRVLLRWLFSPVHGPSNDSVTWLPNSPRMIVAEWGFNGGTKLVNARTGRSRVISKEPWRSVTPASDGKTIGFLYSQSTGRLILGLSRLDGTIVARRKLPFDSVTDYDLWVG